ncbi:DUF5610 domain-containing protein [Endothiovibrio diazotrophicus]
MDVSKLYSVNQPRPESRGSSPRASGDEKGTAVHEAKGEKSEKSEKGDGVGVAKSITEQTRTELNAAIIESASQVSLSAGNQPLHLLYSAAIDKLNEVLAPELGDNAIQKAAEKPEDFTPDATADRIVSFATGFYAAYSEQHPEMAEEDRLNSFMDLIGGAIDQGFGEARDILDGLKVLDGPVKEGVDQTYDLVQKGLQSFRDSILNPKSEEAAEGGSAQTESSAAEKTEGEG